MKKLLTICATFLLTATSFAQAPHKMSYQAVIRNSSNALIINQPVGMRISILQGSASGTAVYVETQTPSTNANGLVSIAIGTGTVVSGTFSAIDWGNGPFFIQTETDPAGGTSYSITGTSELLSVPFALFAANANGTLSNGTAAGNTPYWDGTAWVTNSSNIYNNGGSVGIGTATPAASAALEINSTTGALLLPRLTTAQRDQLAAKIGMIIFNTTDLKAQVCTADSTIPVVDQSNIVYETNIYNAGQSFQAGLSGNWTQLEVMSNYGSPQSGTLNIYSGEGNGGTLLLSQPISLVNGANTITLSTPISITAGNQYTFSTDILMNCSNNTNPYAAGISYTSSSPDTAYDLYFKIIVLPSEAVWSNMN